MANLAPALSADQVRAVFRALQERAHETALKNGHYQGAVTPTETLSRFTEYLGTLQNYVRRSRSLATLSFTDKGKPVGFPALLANVAILALSVAHHHGVDLGEAVLAKMAFNERLRGTR